MQLSTPIVSNLGKVLSVFSYNFYYTEPRDIIYALLGLINTCDDIKFHPDYTKLVELVQIETAEAIMLEERKMHSIAARFPLHRGSIEGLPSWIPNWRDNAAVKISPTVIGTFEPPFKASAGLGTAESLFLKEGPDVLSLEGIL